jgi:hypothetical protein
VAATDDTLAGIDDDELGDDGPVDDGEPGGGSRFVCDVDGCGASFDKASSLGLHKFRTHGIKGARRGGPKRAAGDASPRRNDQATGNG